MKLSTWVACALVIGNLAFGPVAAIAKDDKDDKSKTVAMTGADQHPAPCLSWIDPKAPVRAALLCIHGLGLSSDAYTNFGMREARRGIATYAIDVRGFGSWMRLQGNDQIDFDACLEDIRATLISIRASHPGLPVFVVGESMGGAIALRACSLYPELIDGLISSVPAGSRFSQKKTDLVVALKFLKGRHKEFNEGEQVISQASGDNDKLKADWESDPLDRMNFSAEQLLQFQKFMNENHDAVKKIKATPVLMLQGSQDTLVKPEGTWDLFNALATKEKSFIELPSEHLVLEEGQAKSAKYDASTSQLLAGWIFGAIPDSFDAEEKAAVDPTTKITPLAPATSFSAATAGGVPTVLVFTANWCAECKPESAMIARAKTEFGNAVKIKVVDVDNPANSQLVTALGVAPIPTCVFLSRDGSLNSTLIGRNRYDVMEQRINRLIK